MLTIKIQGVLVKDKLCLWGFLVVHDHLKSLMAFSHQRGPILKVEEKKYKNIKVVNHHHIKNSWQFCKDQNGFGWDIGDLNRAYLFFVCFSVCWFVFFFAFNHRGIQKGRFPKSLVKIWLDLAEILRISKLGWRDGGEEGEKGRRRGGVLLCNG